MRFIFYDKANMGGVYKITNLQNGRIYIGSTGRFKERSRGHKNDLEANRHLNRFLQNDFNKCGSEAFLFEVLEVVEGGKPSRLLREQEYINRFYDNQKNCYNLVPNAMDSRGGTRNKKCVDPLTDGRCKSPTEEVRQKRADATRATWSQPEYRELSRQNSLKQWEKRAADFEVRVKNTETGEECIITGPVKRWCLERALSYKAFNQLLRGKIKSSGGWYVVGHEPVYTSQLGQKRAPLSPEHREKIAGGKYEGVALYNSKTNKTLVLGKNVKEQCRELGLPYTTLLKVVNGECGSVQGYRTSP